MLGEKIEAIRWPLSMTVLSILLILCVILLVGVARHNRCALIAFSVCGLVAVITSYLMASIYLSSSVALGKYLILTLKILPFEFLMFPCMYLLNHCISLKNLKFYKCYQRFQPQHILQTTEAKSKSSDFRKCTNQYPREFWWANWYFKLFMLINSKNQSNYTAPDPVFIALASCNFL